MKLFSTPLPGGGVGNAARMARAAGEILEFGIKFPAKAVRPPRCWDRLLRDHKSSRTRRDT